MSEKILKNHRQILKVGTVLLAVPTVVSGFLPSSDAPVNVRISLAYLLGVVYVSAGIYVFARFSVLKHFSEEKVRAAVMLFIFSVGTSSCFGVSLVSKCIDARYVPGSSYRQVFDIHNSFLIIGGLLHGILGIVLFLLVLNDVRNARNLAKRENENVQ